MKHSLIIAAVDASDDLARAIVVAADAMARRDGARVHVLSAWPRLTAAAAGAAIASPLGPLGEITPEIIEADRQARGNEAHRVAALAAGFSTVAKIEVVDGDAAEAIARYARDEKADVIVAGTHQRGFWKALFEGAPSRDLVREAPCAVFLVTRPYAQRILMSLT